MRNSTPLHITNMSHIPPVQIPLLDTPQGSVWESNAIARYLARQADKGLFGKTRIDEVSPAHALLLPCTEAVGLHISGVRSTPVLLTSSGALSCAA